MAGEFHAAIATLRGAVSALEPECMDGHDAAALLEWVIEGKKLLGAAETLLVKRVDECRIWAADGHRGMADWLAVRNGISVGQANAVVETSQRVASCPATEAALRDGQISTDQAREIAGAALADPATESRPGCCRSRRVPRLARPMPPSEGGGCE